MLSRKKHNCNHSNLDKVNHRVGRSSEAGERNSRSAGTLAHPFAHSGLRPHSTLPTNKKNRNPETKDIRNQTVYCFKNIRNTNTERREFLYFYRYM